MEQIQTVRKKDFLESTLCDSQECECDWDPSHKLLLCQAPVVTVQLTLFRSAQAAGRKAEKGKASLFSFHHQFKRTQKPDQIIFAFNFFSFYHLENKNNRYLVEMESVASNISAALDRL